MNRVVLSNNDVLELFEWRDSHKEEVRAGIAPLKNIEIVCTDVHIKLKCFRESEILKIYLNRNGKSLGHTEFWRRNDGMWIENNAKKRLQETNENIQSMLTLYCTVMALMAFGNSVEEEEYCSEKNTSSTSKKRAYKKRSSRITYILRKTKKKIMAVKIGSHASPRGIFTVRGHYRHYRNGKVVWVAEYKKGTGDRKKKTYKVGWKIDGN